MAHSDFSPEQIPNAARDLEEEAILLPNPAEYIEDIRDKYIGKSFLRYYIAMAHVAQPVGENSSNDEAYMGTIAFFRGELLALRASELARGEEFMANLCGVVQIASGIRSPEEGGTAQELAGVINAVGEEGFRLSTPYHELLGRWSSDISTDPLQVPCIMRGFGVVMFMANAAMLVEAVCEEQADLALMEQQISQPIDWDAGLRNLLD